MAQIKDFFELTAYDEQTQFRDTDPELIVASYLFTDLTANVATNLLTYLSAPGPVSPKMICGPRGVGKSHLLSVIHRLAENPSRKTKIQHQQVKTVAGRLGALLPITLYLDNDLRTPFSDALSAAIRTATHGTVSFQPSGDHTRDLTLLSESLISITPVILIDGLSNRLKSGVRDRVRDDLEWLGTLSEKAYGGRIRVIITLDDDAAKSDVDLSVLSQNYQPENLGLDCLKEIIGQCLFKKSSRNRAELQALYKRVKAKLPHFYWSESDFVTLFPMHPIILEVAASLRSHISAFSLLGFASSAAVRATGRPPLSLIMLDEAFDRFEYELRKNGALSAAFATYDKLLNSIGANAPPAHRITTRLLLKSLFIISLTGHGAGVQRLAEALMLVDERVNGYVLANECLTEVSQRAGSSVIVTGEGDQRTLCLPIGDTNDLESAIEAEAVAISDQDPRLLEILVGIGGRCFSDWPFTYDRQQSKLHDKASMSVLWRGAEREGILCFNHPLTFRSEEAMPYTREDRSLGEISDSLLELDLGAQEPDTGLLPSSTSHETDWEVILQTPNTPVPAQTQIPSGVLVWSATEATGSDWKYIVKLFLIAQRFSVDGSRVSPRLELLLGDLRTRVIEQFEKIYLNNGTIVGRQVNSPLSDRKPNQTLSALLSGLLDPALTVRFSQHPTFGGLVTPEKIEALHRGLLCGENPTDATVQSYAAQFAVPLSLTRKTNGAYELDIESDECATSPVMVAIRKLIEGSPQGVVPLADALSLMRRPPFGLQTPIQRIILSALVAGWQIELTNSAATEVLTPANLARDLDLSRYTLLRRTATIVYSTERLSEWCGRLLNDHIWFDLSTADGRRQVREAFADWQKRWVAIDLDRRMAALPEEAPTAKVGQMYYTCKRYFDRVAAAITAMLQGRVPLEQGLTHIVDIFAGNETVFDRLASDLTKLSEFLDWAPWAIRAREFIETADYTGDQHIEKLRHELTKGWEDPNKLLDSAERTLMVEQAEEFNRAYQTVYIDAHDSPERKAAMNSFTELLESNEWQKCRSELETNHISERMLAITSLVNELNHHRCESDVRSNLASASHCDCGFSLYSPDDPARLFGMLKRLLTEEIGSPISVMIPTLSAAQQASLSASHPITDALDIDNLLNM